MNVQEITDLDAFLALEAEWNDLCRRSQCDSFFLSHAWSRCCWLGKAEDAQPFVVVVRDGSGVVGLAPFFADTMKWRVFPVRAMRLMQNQDSPFADIVAVPDRAGEILQAILHHLRRSPKSDVVVFGKIPRASLTHGLLVNCGTEEPLIRVAGGQSPILQLDGDWAGFWTAQSQRFKKTVRNVANRVERLGRVTAEELSAAASAEECMQVFASVADRSWKAGLPISLRCNPSIARFFEALTSVLHACGQLRLWTLRLDGLPIATEYHVHDGDTVYALRSDFDDRYREASPGAYLNQHIVRTYFERGVRIYDMGPGDNSYKLRWATSAKELDSFVLFGRSAYVTALYGLERHLIPHLRRAQAWWAGRGGRDTPAPGISDKVPTLSAD
jgi:CelD/BcsL family acetyltransferase involved in cellulose biosynthesis